MNGYRILLCLVVYCLGLIRNAAADGGSATAKCLVDDIKVMADFNMTKMFGTWYEMYWIPSYFEKPEQVWDNFEEVWSESKTEGQVDVQAVGRPINATECGSFSKSYKKSESEEEAKWETPRRFNATFTLMMDVWIISTNYNSYSLIYGCTTLAEDGTCSNHHGWVWSRTRALAADDQKEIEDKLPTLCLEWMDWDATPMDKPCPDDDNGSETSGAPGVGGRSFAISFAALLVLMIHH